MSRIDEALRRTSERREGPGDARSIDESGSAALRAFGLEPSAEQPKKEQPKKEQPQKEQPHRAVAVVPPASRRVGIRPLQTTKLVVNPALAPVSVEQYRRLAATLHDLQATRGLKTLMVSSAVPHEGKTLTVVNLALTLSESFHRRVLLIDADLRRPSIHDVLGIPNTTGLSEVIRSSEDSLPVIEVSQWLSVLTAGHPNATPMAQLTSDRTAAVVKRAAEQFDWVLLDTPPVGLMPDAQLIARLSEAVVFVVAAGMTPYRLVQHSITELGPDRIVGIVLNRVEERQVAMNDYYRGYDTSRKATS